MAGSAFQLHLPDDFDAYAWEVEAKGWYPDAILIFDGKRYVLNFYDAMRLAQSVEGDVSQDSLFFEPNVIVIPVVTRAAMEQATAKLVNSGRFKALAGN